MPKLHFPGGALIGCSAGFVNVAKIKGTHNAMKSGMLAAETAYEALETASHDQPSDMSTYEGRLLKSWVYDDLYEVRNLRPSFNTALGIWGGMLYSGIDSLFLKGRTPWTFHHSPESDAAHTKRASQCLPIEYPPFEPPLSTDLLTSVALTGTNHAEDQPVHLRVRRYQATNNEVGTEGQQPKSELETPEPFTESKEGRKEQVRLNVGEYAGLLGRACPAQVYEYVEDETSQGPDGEGWDGKKLVINSQVRNYCFRNVVSLTSVDRIASTVNFVISRCQHRISPGPSQRVEADQNTVCHIIHSVQNYADQSHTSSYNLMIPSTRHVSALCKLVRRRLSLGYESISYSLYSSPYPNGWHSLRHMNNELRLVNNCRLIAVHDLFYNAHFMRVRDGYDQDPVGYPRNTTRIQREFNATALQVSALGEGLLTHSAESCHEL